MTLTVDCKIGLTLHLALCCKSVSSENRMRILSTDRRYQMTSLDAECTIRARNLEMLIEVKSEALGGKYPVTNVSHVVLVERT